MRATIAKPWPLSDRGIQPRDKPAGGRDARKRSWQALRDEGIVVIGAGTLRRTHQSDSNRARLGLAYGAPVLRGSLGAGGDSGVAVMGDACTGSAQPRIGEMCQ